MSDSKRAKKQPRPTQHGLTDVDPLLSGSPKLEGRQNSGRARRKAVANSITFESIEPRILLSSDPFAMASPAASASYTASDWTDPTPLIALSQDLPALPIPAAGNPVEGNASEDEPLLTASSAQPATQSQLSITKVEVTLDPDGRVTAGTSILITAKNTSGSTFYGQVWAYLMLWNNEDKTGPSQALLNNYYDGFIRLDDAKIGNDIVDISDNSYRVTIASNQEVVFHYRPSPSERTSGGSPNLFNDYDEIGSARGDVIMPGTAYLRTELTTLRPSGSWLWSNAVTSPALNVSFADLEIIDVAIPQRIVVGEAVDFSVTVKNRGNEAVYNRGWPGSSFTASLSLGIDGEFEPQQGNSYISQNLLVYPSKTLWQSMVNNNNGAVVSIAPGASHVFNFRYNYFGLQQADEVNLKKIKGFYFNIEYKNMATNRDSRIDSFYLTDTGKIVGDFTLTEVPRPDLKLEIMDFTLVNGEGAMVPYKITNVGDAPLLSQDLEIVTPWAYKVQIPGLALAPGETFTGSGYWDTYTNRGFFPRRGIVSETFTLIGALEYNTENNSVIKQFSSINVPNIIPLGPNHWDRKIGIDDLLKPPLIAGATVTTKWEVYNGEGEQEQIREDAFYWSKNATLDADDTPAARVTRTMPLQESKTVTEASVTLPAAGDWYLLMRVDDTNTIAETNESDNVMASPLLQVAPLGRDLAIGAVTVPSSVIAGELLEVSWNALNVGDVAVSGLRTERVVLRKGGQQFTYDFTYDDLLQPGASESRRQSILLPATISGIWDVTVIVDPDNLMAEPGGENNNEAAPVQVNIAAGRNLVVSDVQGPSIAVAEQMVQVDWRVRNTGGGAATQGWKDSIYLSSNAVPGEDDRLLATVDNQRLLAAGAEYAASALVRLPDDIADNYHILVATDASGQVAEAVETDNVSASESFLVTDTPPQLVASALTMPTSMLSNVPTAISWKVTNSGTGPVGNVSWTDSIFISADAVFDAQDERVADFTYRGPLAAGENAAVTRHENITLKEGLAGSFYFFVVTDSWNRIYEYGYEEDNRAFRLNGNNEIAPVEIYATNPPDLEVTALSLSTSTALSGQVITAQATIANNGASALSQNARWTDQFYLSSDQYLDEHDSSLGSQQLELRNTVLAPGASYTVNLDLPLGDRANGVYYVIAVADQAQETFDLARNNNIRVSDPLAVQRLPADLQVSNVQAPAFLAANVPSEVSYVVSNTGSGLTTRSSWTDRLWISKDDVLGNGDDTLVGTFQHTAPLAAGASREVTASITPPQEAVGSYRLFVVTNANSDVPEYSGPAYGGETNNVATGPLTTVLQTLADLVVSNLEALDTVRPGQVVSVTWQVNNQGVGSTNVSNWKDAFFISKTGLIDDKAVRLNAVQREGVLATGESYTGSALLEIPPDLQTGDYHLIVMADWPEYAGVGVLEGAKESANESNNTFSLPLTLAGAPMRPDLRVSNFQSPQNGIGGLPVTLSWEVKNVGEAIAKPGFYDLVYLSLDGALNRKTDIPLGSVKREAPLNPGQTDRVEATFTIPLGYVGAYHVILLAGDDLPYETARADNLSVAQQTMLIREAHVDLQVVSTTAPTSAAFNEATSISYTVKNNGPDNIARRTWHDRVFLSTNAELDSDDTQLATVRQDRALDAGASYTAEVTAPLQGITPGTYYVIVAADFADSLNETNEANNVLAAEPPLDAAMPALGYGATATASLPQSGAMLYYRLQVPAGEAFRVTLDGTGTDGAAALYVAFNRIPKPGNADHSGVVGYTLDQTIVVPQTEAGIYYIAVRGEALRQDTPFSLSVQKMDFAVTATSVEVLGNTGPATLRIHGALFDASTRFFLKGPDDVVVEGRVRQMTNAGEAVATFFLEDAPVGSYQLIALKGQQTADFAKTIQVKKDFAGKVVADFNGPAALLNGDSPGVNFGYSNAGGADLMAPLFILTDQRGGSIGSSVDDADARPMQILGASLQGNPILLEPGAAFTYRLVLKNVSAASGIEVSAKAVTTTDERVIDAVSWLELKNSLRPEKLSWKDWTTYWDRIRPQLGKTWGEYVVNVNGMMVALTAANEPPVRDVRELFRRLNAIDGNVAPDVSGRLVDSVTGQPVVGVEISLQGINDAGQSFVAGTALSDASGAFVIPRVGWGQYRLLTDRPYDLNLDGEFYDPELQVLVLPGANVSIATPLRIEPEQNEAEPQRSVSTPRFATDADGRLHGVWVDGTDIVYSSFDGTSWSPATVIVSPGDIKELYINFSPKLLDDTIPALLVTWVSEGKNSSNTTIKSNLDEIFAIVGQLTNSSQVTWFRAFKVTSDSVRDSQVSVAILPDGDALLTFLKKDEGIQDDADVYFTRLDLFTVNLGTNQGVSPSSLNGGDLVPLLAQSMSPERADFIFNRGDYEVRDFAPTSREVFEQTSLTYNRDWEWKFDELVGKKGLGFLQNLPGKAKDNKTKFEVEFTLREKSLFEEREKINQFILVVKKQPGVDVFGRLTQKESQLLYHGNESLLDATITSETKFADHKLKVVFVSGGSVESRSPIWSAGGWETGKIKLNTGLSVTYTHETALIQLMKKIGKAAVASAAASPIGLGLVAAANGLEGFRNYLKDNKLGTLDLGLGATFGAKGDWEFDQFEDVLPKVSPSKTKGSLSFAGVAFGQLKFGNQLKPDGTNLKPDGTPVLSKDEEYFNSNVLKDALVAKVQGQLGAKMGIPSGEVSGFFKISGEFRLGWLYAKPAWNWGDPPFALDWETGVEPQFPGYVNLGTSGNSNPLFPNSLSGLSSVSSIPPTATPPTTPDFEYLYKSTAVATGSNSVYVGQSLLGNVASDLYDDGSPTLTTLADGRTLAIWSRSSATELGNRLYSAIFDGVGWSVPTAISGTYGFNSKVTAVKGLDGHVSIIWTQADPSSLENVDRVTFEEASNVLRSTKVFHLVFDGQGFSAPSQVSAMPGMAAGTMALSQSDGSILLSWTQTGLDDRQSLFYAVWDGAKWSVPGLIASDIYVRTQQLQSIGGQAHVIWTGNLSVDDQEPAKTFVQKLSNGTWSAPQVFTLPSVAVVSPASGPLTPSAVSSTDELPEEVPLLDVPPWPAINIDDFYNIGKDQSLSLKNLLSNDAGTAEEKSKMQVEKVNGQGPGTFTVTSKGGRQATITVTANGNLSFTPGADFQNLRENQVDVVRFLYVINDVGSLYEGELLTEDLRTSVVEINVFGEDPPPEPPEPPPGPPPPGPIGPYSPPVLWSNDPNDILGPVGHGPENWINANTPLGYTIRFENMAEATAPARKVVITQTLDTDLDARSLRFGDIGFGDVVLDVPEGASYISQRLDLLQTRGVYVDVLATVNITTRTAIWILTAIDPETGDVPQDGSVGFLPPNGAAGEGQGFVEYRISARPEAQNGARIDAAAEIVFDNEAPLVTPSIFNTIDRVEPTSAVTLVGEVTVEGKASLTWAGTDGMTGAGIASYTILVAKDGGPFAVWLEDTASTGAIFNGEPGSSYAFYSLARDYSGLREAPPATPDVSLIIPGIPRGAVAGTIFDDLNQNGLRESGEPVLAGATVFLDADGDGLLDPAEISTTTSAAGGFNLAGVRSGAYKLRVVDGTGTILATRDLSISSGQQLANLGDGAFTPGRISGIVFDDTDGDGLQEPGEAALSGAVVFLDDNDNGLKDTGETAVTTGADGVFVFGGLAAGPRKLVLDAVNGRVPTGSSTRSATVTSGLDLTVNFGTVVPGKIEGILFEDANGDGVRNGTERGLSGWTVFLDGNGNGLRDAGEAQLTTGMTGSYSFTGLKPGSYTVSVTRPSGWLQTSDPEAALGTVQVQSASTSALGATAAGRGAAAALTGLSALQSDPAFAGITGAGIGIAVVDSGIDADHPFFGPDADGNGVADRIVAQYDFVDNDANADDAFGHGTHIAGIVASQDATYGGVAPEANIVALRVLDTKGSGSFSRLEAALQWTLTNADKYNIRVVNLSMGDNQNWQNSTSLYGIGDELAALAARDILVIAAAGNGFYTFNSKPGVSYPAADPNVIAVGAVWATESSNFSAAGAIDFTTAPDRIAALSQRHAGLVDVFAPGMQIVSAGIGGGTSVLSGTSQAAGFTTGVAALAQQIALDKLGRPLKVQEFIDLLSSTSRATLDGDDENDNVTNTSKSYPLLDTLELAQAIAKLNPESTGVTVTPAVAPASVQVAAPGSISISPGSNILAPIGLFGSFAVSGSVFLDANRNNVYDSGEAMLAGARLVLDMDGNGAFSLADQMVVTTSGGGFTFANLGPGSKQLGVQTNDGQMFWLSSLSSTSRVNINSLQLPFQLPEVDAPSDGDTGGRTGPGGLPDTNPVYDPGRNTGPREGADWDWGSAPIAGAVRLLETAFVADLGRNTGPRGGADWDWGSAPIAGAVRLPETAFVTDPGRNTGSGKGYDGGGPINSGAVSRSPAMTTSFSLGGDRSTPLPGLPNREFANSPALTPDGTPAPAVAPTGANRMAGERTSSSSMPSPSEPMSSKARADQLRMAQPAQPQSSQSDQQGSSATEPAADPGQALDAAVESLGRVLPAQEARRLLVAAPSDTVILLDESVFEPVPIRATTPERHPRGDWVADFLTNAGKVMQGPGDELIVLAAGTAARQAGGKRQAPGRDARQGRPRDAARPTERIA